MDGVPKQKKYRLEPFIKATLRRASYRWPGRTEALGKARIERGLYKCAKCEGTFKKNQVSLDHIEPVVPVKEGFTNWDDYVKRMFPEASGFQVLCANCHTIKTAQEQHMRKFYRKKVDKRKKKG